MTKMKERISNDGKDIEELECSHIAGGSVN